MRNLIQVTCTLKVCHLLWVSNIMHGKWTFTWLYMKRVSRQVSTDLVRVIVVVEMDKRQYIVEVNLPGCTGRRGVWAINDLEGVCAPPASILPLPNALFTQDLAEVRWAEMEAGLDPARVRHTEWYGEEVNVFGEENHSLSSKQGLTPLSSAYVSQVPPWSWAMAGTPAVWVEVYRLIWNEYWKTLMNLCYSYLHYTWQFNKFLSTCIR